MFSLPNTTLFRVIVLPRLTTRFAAAAARDTLKEIIAYINRDTPYTPVYHYACHYHAATPEDITLLAATHTPLPPELSASEAAFLHAAFTPLFAERDKSSSLLIVSHRTTPTNTPMSNISHHTKYHHRLFVTVITMNRHISIVVWDVTSPPHMVVASAIRVTTHSRQQTSSPPRHINAAACSQPALFAKYH